MDRLFPGLAVVFVAVAIPAISMADAGRATFESGVNRVAVIELYTSEGCSSCPPADRWLSQLKSDPRLWEDFVPLAFHVDYWDYIGWRDRFARAEFSQRQRRYAAEGGVPTVYTPGFLKDGTEWRGWLRTDSPRSDDEPVGALRIRLEGDLAAVRFRPGANEYGGLVAHVAVLGMGMSSQVRAGENRGRTLRHDFVVLEMASQPMQEEPEGFSVTIPLDEKAMGEGTRALAAWISFPDRQEPIQAVGGFL